MKAKKILAILVAASACLSMAAMSVSAEATPAKPDPALLDGSKFTLDGKLSDWEGLNALTVQGTDEYAKKSVTFYGAMTTTGLYLACDAYHGTYITNKPEWHKNSNFEMFVNSNVSVYAYATGLTSDCKFGAKANATCQITKAVMKTDENKDDETKAKYHTVTEVFIATSNLPKGYAPKIPNTVSVGLAWKTPGDQLKLSADLTSEYWRFADGVNTDPAKYPLIATPQGLYRGTEYTAPLLRQGEFQLRKNGEDKYDMRLLFLGDSEYLKDFKNATVTITFTKSDGGVKKTKTMTHTADKAYKTIKATINGVEDTYKAADGYGYIGLVVQGIGTNDVDSFSASVTLNYNGDGSVTYYLGKCDYVAAEVAKLSK